MSHYSLTRWISSSLQSGQFKIGVEGDRGMTCRVEDYQLFHHQRTNGYRGSIVLFCHKEISEGVEVMWVCWYTRVSLLNCLHHLLCAVPSAPLPRYRYVPMNLLIHISCCLRVRVTRVPSYCSGNLNEIDTTGIQDQLLLSQAVDISHTRSEHS